MKNPAVLITGGAKRIGAALARYFAANGYDVALHYNRSKGDALKLQKELRAIGVACELFQHDLSSVKGIKPLMASVKKAMPNCVALINNASIFERAEFLKTDEKLFDRQFGINFKAPFFLTQAFALTFGKGCVVNMLDTQITGNGGSHFAYLLAKKNLAEFTAMAAKALGPRIRVGGICPGVMLAADAKDKAYQDKMAALLPLREHPSLEELAEAALWLVEQKHITGQLIFVDGGMHVL